MPLNKDEREALFGTKVMTMQLTKYMSQHGSKSISELRDVFFEISRGRLMSHLMSLVANKVLRRDGEVFYFQAGEVKVSIADRVWKAALLLKTFTIQDLARTAESTERYAGNLAKQWLNHGYLTAQRANRKIIYSVRVPRSTRPGVNT